MKPFKVKNIYLLIFLISLFAIIFIIQYYSISEYIEKMFLYTSDEIRTEALNNELEQLNSYWIEIIILLLLQNLGMFICLNIGFLYFKTCTSIKHTIQLVLTSSLATIFIQFLAIFFIKINNWTFTVGSLNSFFEKLNLTNYLNAYKVTPWLELSLTCINITQLLTVILLVLVIHKILKLNYKKAFLITVRTYGLGVLLWFVFAMVMEMNFG